MDFEVMVDVSTIQWTVVLQTSILVAPLAVLVIYLATRLSNRRRDQPIGRISGRILRPEEE